MSLEPVASITLRPQSSSVPTPGSFTGGFPAFTGKVGNVTAFPALDFAAVARQIPIAAATARSASTVPIQRNTVIRSPSEPPPQMLTSPRYSLLSGTMAPAPPLHWSVLPSPRHPWPGLQAHTAAVRIASQTRTVTSKLEPEDLKPSSASLNAVMEPKTARASASSQPRERRGSPVVRPPASAMERLKVMSQSSKESERHEAPSNDRAEEVLTALCRLQKALDQQQAEQKSAIAKLSSFWEERFATVLSCLQKASQTTEVIRERSEHYVRLHEVMENSLHEMSQNSRHLAQVTVRLDELEEEVGRLADQSEAEGPETEAPEANRRRRRRRRADQDNYCSSANEADPTSALNQRLDLLSAKLSRLSNELQNLRNEVPQRWEAVPTSPIELGDISVDSADQVKLNSSCELSSSIRSTAAGVLPPRSVTPKTRRAVEEAMNEESVCGAGSPPRPHHGSHNI